NSARARRDPDHHRAGGAGADLDADLDGGLDDDLGARRAVFPAGPFARSAACARAAAGAGARAKAAAIRWFPSWRFRPAQDWRRPHAADAGGGDADRGGRPAAIPRSAPALREWPRLWQLPKW